MSRSLGDDIKRVGEVLSLIDRPMILDEIDRHLVSHGAETLPSLFQRMGKEWDDHDTAIMSLLNPGEF